MITDLRSFLKVSCHTKFRFAEREAQCILGECGPLSREELSPSGWIRNGTDKGEGEGERISPCAIPCQHPFKMAAR